ncbi:MAG: hypothetical protein AAF441_16065 [Pseudomonadota bacterium]
MSSASGEKVRGKVMRWFANNPEVMRPLAVCLLLVGGAVLAEAVSNSGPEPAKPVVYETKIKLERPVQETKQAFQPSPYFDLEDPEG